MRWAEGVKIIGQNHQFLDVNKAIASMLAARKLGHGRGGVFWQTQGSGKSFSMVFFAQKIRVDIMVCIPALTFEDAWPNRVETLVGNVVIPFNPERRDSR